MSVDRGCSFVDTNVLVYAFEKGDSGRKLVAQELLGGLMDDNRLRTSTQVLQELFVTLTRKVKLRLSSAEALAVMEELTAWPVFSVDYKAIRAAVELADDVRISLWDALVVVAADRSGAGILYTEDLKDGQEILGVRISNPFKA
jgi:predicted nucleic acid-binding protein